MRKIINIIELTKGRSESYTLSYSIHSNVNDFFLLPFTRFVFFFLLFYPFSVLSISFRLFATGKWRTNFLIKSHTNQLCISPVVYSYQYKQLETKRCYVNIFITCDELNVSNQCQCQICAVFQMNANIDVTELEQNITLNNSREQILK